MIHPISAATLAPLPVYRAPLTADLLSPFPLRDYQLAILLRAAALMRMGYRRILIQMPTGAGKTVLAAALLACAMQRDFDSQFIVHRKELLDQTSLSFTNFGIEHGFIASGRSMAAPSDRVVLSGVQTLVNRLGALFPPNLAVVDECHHATAASWTRTLNWCDGFTIGLTATPERLDGKGLSDLFDVMIEGPSVAELIRRGYLSRYEYYAPEVPDLSGIETVAGDFNKGQTAEFMDRPMLIGNVVEHNLSLAKGEQGIVFAASVEHSRHLAEAFTGEGVPAAHVDGAMDDKSRSYAVDSFKAGDCRIMTNVDLFGEGFDVPNIVYVGLARPTKSLSLHRQQVGRALRVLPGKSHAIICDHAGNALRLQDLPDTERKWSLEGRAKRAASAGPSDANSVRQCLVCFMISYSTDQVCRGCGTAFPRKDRKVKEGAGKLTKLEQEMLKKQAAAQRKEEEDACRGYSDFVELHKARGNPGDPHKWAKLKMSMRRGTFWRKR